jgi:hypothetical protein
MQTRLISFLLTERTGANQRGGGGPGGRRCRCSSELGARLRHGIEGGSRGKCEDVLTGANNEERRARSGRRRTVSSPTRSPVGAAATARLAAGRGAAARARARFIGARAPCLGVQGTHA